MAENPTSGMAAQLGLLAQGSFNPLGMPTPPQDQAPYVMHPGQLSASLAQQSQAAAFQTMQVTQLTRPTPFTGVPSDMGGGGGGGGGLGSYAQQYRANQAQLQGQLFNPYAAQTMASMTGMRGYNQGMMPSPTSLTDPSMGIFRPFAQSPAPTIQPVPQLPLIPTPFTPSLPTPMFSMPLDYSMSRGYSRADQTSAAAWALPGTAARVGVDIGASRVGAGLGALFGARLGGATGARAGTMVGGLLGLYGAESGGLGAGAQHLVDAVEPFSKMSARGAQMQTMTQGFVVGGANLSLDGNGMGQGSASHLGRMVEDLSYDRSFRRDTSKMFSTQDLGKILQSGSQHGIFDMAQTPDQIKDQLKNVAKAVKTFMQVANEPDLQEAIKQLGQFRAMGMGVGESVNMARNAKMYARMAGTTVKGIMETGGLPGAMTFQQFGLSAGLGMDVGMGALGMARQAVAAGAYTPQQLALLGGTQGIAQREMQSQAAMLRLPMMAASMSTIGAGGTFGMHAGNVQQLMGGHIGVDNMASMGVNNLQSAVSRHGIGALGMFQMQQSELQDQLGRTMGPVGMKMMRFRQIQNLQKTLGIEGPGGFATAAQAMGMDTLEARQAMSEANSPSFFQGLQRQLDKQITDVRMQTQDHRRATDPGFFARSAQRMGFSDVGNGSSAFARGFRNMSEAGGVFFDERAQDAAFGGRGMTIQRLPSELVSLTAGQERQLASASSQDMNAAEDRVRARIAARGPQEDPLFRIGGHGYGRSSLMSAYNRAAGERPLAEAVNMARGGNSIGRAFANDPILRLMFGDNNATLGAEADDIEAGSSAIQRGLGATTDEQGAALDRFGGKKNRGATEKIVGDSAAEIANLIRSSKRNTFGTNSALKGSEIDDAVRRMIRQNGGNPNGDINDIKSAVFDQLKGTLAKGDLASLSSPHPGEVKDALAQQRTSGELLEDRYRENARLYGSGGGSVGKTIAMGVGGAVGLGLGAFAAPVTGGVSLPLGGITGANIAGALYDSGERSAQWEADSILYSDSNPAVAAMASLMAAEAAGLDPGASQKIAALRQHLGKDSEDVTRRATAIKQRGGDGGHLEHFAQNARAMTDGGGPKDWIDKHDKHQHDNLSQTRTMRRQAGLRKMLPKDSSVFAAKSDGSESMKSILTRLASSPTALDAMSKDANGKSTASYARRIAMLDPTTQGGEIDKIVAEAERYQTQLGGAASAEEVAGGESGGTMERVLKKMTGETAETGAAMKDSFPNSVATFQEAVEMFSRSVAGQTSTSLDAPTNSLSNM